VGGLKYRWAKSTDQLAAPPRANALARVLTGGARHY
jgi:hypothetical protein